MVEFCKDNKETEGSVTSKRDSLDIDAKHEAFMKRYQAKLFGILLAANYLDVNLLLCVLHRIESLIAFETSLQHFGLQIRCQAYPRENPGGHSSHVQHR